MYFVAKTAVSDITDGTVFVTVCGVSYCFASPKSASIKLCTWEASGTDTYTSDNEKDFSELSKQAKASNQFVPVRLLFVFLRKE